MGSGPVRLWEDWTEWIHTDGFLNTPPILLNALSKLGANHNIGRNNIPTHLSAVDHVPKFECNNAGPDILLESDYKQSKDLRALSVTMTN